MHHFVLFKTHQLKQHLMHWQQQLQHSSSYGIVSLTADIKNMFSNLNHAYIIDSVIWLLQHAHSHVHSRHVTRLIVERCKKPSVHWYPAFGDMENHVMIALDEIIPIVIFDVQHIYFTVGDLILKQQQGAPMGGFISANYAILSCAASEYRFHASLASNIHFFARRYMDDLLCLIAYSLDDQTSYNNALETLTHLSEHCYHKDLELEPTSTSNTDPILHYLDAHIHVTLSHAAARDCNTRPFITTTTNLKNWDSIRTSRHQVILTYQHYHSLTRVSCKAGVVKSALLRIHRTTTCGIEFLLNVMKLHLELSTLCYPPFILTSMLASCYRDTQHLWFQYTKHILQAWERSVKGNIK